MMSELSAEPVIETVSPQRTEQSVDFVCHGNDIVWKRDAKRYGQWIEGPLEDSICSVCNFDELRYYDMCHMEDFDGMTEEHVQEDMGIEMSAGKIEPVLPSEEEIEEHKRTHLPYRSWCKHCTSWLSCGFTP